MRFTETLIACMTLNAVSASSYTILLSDFTSQTDDWGAGADHFRSTQDAIDPGNWYMRVEINMFGGETNKNRMVVRRPVASDVIGSDPWLVDFNAKAIQSVELDFNNWSADEPVYLRLALSNVTKPMISSGTWWVSTKYATFPPGSGWGSASFNITEAEMQRVGDFNGGFGQDTFEETLSNIQGFRLIASSTGSSALGDEFSGAIGVDNIRLISSICIGENTLIATDSGEVEIQDLTPSHSVDGERVRDVTKQYIGVSAEVQRMVKIAQNALHPGVPNRDTFLTDYHMVYHPLYNYGKGVQASQMVNRETIEYVAYEGHVYNVLFDRYRHIEGHNLTLGTLPPAQRQRWESALVFGSRRARGHPARVETMVGTPYDDV